MQHCFIEVYVNIQCNTNGEQAAKDIKKQLENITERTSYVQNAEVETEYIRLTVGTTEIKIKYSYNVSALFHKGYPATLESPGRPDYFDAYIPDEAQADMVYDIEQAIINSEFELSELEVTDRAIDNEESLMDKLIEVEDDAYQVKVDSMIDEMLLSFGEI